MTTKIPSKTNQTNQAAARLKKTVEAFKCTFQQAPPLFLKTLI